MIVGELAITDGTKYIDLKSGAFRLVEWTPAISEGSATETFQLRVVTGSQNDTIKETQELRRLLEKAKDYWDTNYQNEPVWIVARGNCETNTRYAYIVSYTAARDDDPYQSPFYGRALATMDEWALELERTDWMANEPGTGSCVAIASQQTYWSGSGTDTAAPTQSADDCEVDLSANTISLVMQHTHIGGGGATRNNYANGIRFRGVLPPAGATITYARIDVVATDNDATGNAQWKVYGELNAAPAVFTTVADFMGRTLTTNSAYEANPLGVGWTAGSTYTIMRDTATSRALIQEIINLPGWVAANNLAVLIFDAGSSGFRRYASWDDALQEPVLYLSWTTGTSAAKGRAATCTNEVYFANKHNMAQITHAYYYDATAVAYSGNLIGSALPYSIFPNVFDVPPASPAVGDILYIGIESAIVDSGPFTSVVFDLTLIGPNILGVAWEYWNGGWVNLIISEATIYDMVNGWFGVQGVGSIAFNQPGDWATNNPGMGVTGYWIRARITSIGWVMATSPQQRNRDIYTVVRPSVDIDELQVLGDIPALAQSLIYTWGDYHNIKSIIMGTRSSDRGSSFRMYLNLSDEQNPAGVNVTPGLNTAFAAYMEAPTGRAIRYNPGAGQTGVVSISLDASISNDYFGRYRCYLRVDREAAVTDCTAQLKIGLQDASGLYTSYYYTSETLTIASEVEAYLLDFGIVDVPGFGIAANNEILMPLIFEINLANTTANPDVYLYDLILIPIDEWSGEFANYNPDVNLEALGIVVYPEYHYLDVNSLDMKRRVSAFMRYSENGELRYSWKVITSEEMQLQANADQQLFVLMRSWDTADNVWIAEVKEIGTTQLYANARYLSMRGSR